MVMFDSYADLPQSYVTPLVALEDFIGDIDGKTVAIPTADDKFIDDGTVDADDAVKAVNTIASLLKDDREKMRRWQDVVVQAMACIKGETPEDVSFGEAEDDTYTKLREVEAEISTALKL